MAEFREPSRSTSFFRGQNVVEHRDKLVRSPEGLLKTDALEVKETKNGLGLFARREIKAGEAIFCIDGQEIVMSEEEEGIYHTEGEIKGLRNIDRGRNSDVTYPNAICVGKKPKSHNIWLNPNSDSPLRYLNHSCQPNSGRTSPYFFAALQNIEPGQEITADYATIEVNPRWKMVCQCGQENCRGTIGSVQSLSLDLAEHYWPNLPEFMRRIYLDHARTAFTSPEDKERVAVLEATKGQGFEGF